MKTDRTYSDYHESSKLRSDDIDLYTWIAFVNSDPVLRKVLSSPSYEYERGRNIKLPDTERPALSPIDVVLRNRRTRRAFSGAATTLGKVSSLLKMAASENSIVEFPDGVSWSFRSYPSGGALYPVELYVALVRINGADSGLYYYNPKLHSLAMVDSDSDAVIGRVTVAMSTTRAAIESSSMIIFMVTDLARMSFKYQERAYRFALLECGHCAQNILLSAEALNLGSLPAGAFIDDELNDLLNLDGVEAAVQYVLLVGESPNEVA